MANAFHVPYLASDTADEKTRCATSAHHLACFSGVKRLRWEEGQTSVIISIKITQRTTRVSHHLPEKGQQEVGGPVEGEVGYTAGARCLSSG